MSWIAMAIGPTVHQALGMYEASKKNPSFGQCSYCQRLPDTHQTNANCLGCGAALPRSTTPTTMNYNNHDNRKKNEKFATKKGVYSRPAPTPITHTPADTNAYVPISFYHADP